MSSNRKTKFVDRDDFEPDHYADFIRDIHRSRLTLDQLDIARRQLRRKEKLLSRTFELKLKEHVRVKNEFIRKIEKDPQIATLPIVKQTLKNQQHHRLNSTTPNSSIVEQIFTKSKEKPTANKIFIEWKSPKIQRTEINLKKFNKRFSIFA